MVKEEKSCKTCRNSSVTREPSSSIECATCTRNPDLEPLEVGDHWEPS